jgi:hypothetical protein
MEAKKVRSEENQKKIRLSRDSSKEEGGGVLKSPETSWTKVIVSLCGQQLKMASCVV